MLKTIKWMAVATAMMIILACASSPKSESAGEYLDSTALTAKVKTTLVNELGTKGFSIQVKTYKDEVQLSGFVDTPRTKARAASIAYSLQGVKRVRNDIIVK